MKSGIYFALDMAFRAGCRDEVPVGAVIIDKLTSKVLAAEHNNIVHSHNPLAHAEMLAIEKACRQKASRYLEGCEIYVTLEPCPMCAQAISIARLDAVYFGAEDPKSGGVLWGPRIFDSSSAHHKPSVKSGLQSEVSGQLMHDFFLKKRNTNFSDSC